MFRRGGGWMYVPPPGPGCRYVYMRVWVTYLLLGGDVGMFRCGCGCTYLLLGRDVGMFICGCGLHTSSWAGM